MKAMVSVVLYLLPTGGSGAQLAWSKGWRPTGAHAALTKMNQSELSQWQFSTCYETAL